MFERRREPTINWWVCYSKCSTVDSPLQVGVTDSVDVGVTVDLRLSFSHSLTGRHSDWKT